jgi:hypothetical protein
MATIIPTAGTVTKFISESVGTGSPATATLDQNESPTTLSGTSPAPGQFVEESGNLSVSPGDVLDVFMTGFSSTSAVYASAVFVPDVAGQFVIPTWRNVLTDADPLFYVPVTGRSDDNLQPVEAQAQQIGDNVQIQAVFARATVAPGSGAQYSFTLRDNGANTTLNTTLSGTNLTACTTSAPVTGCNSGSAITVNDFDLLDTSVMQTGSPASAVASVSYLAYVPQLAFTTEPPATGTAGTALGPLVVQLQDANGNSLTGSTAQVSISSSPSGVGGTLSVNAVNGVATFSNLVFNTQGNYTLSAVASGLTAVTSSSISILAAPAPVASLTSPLSFPNTVTGTTSAALASTLSNTGTAPLNNIIPSITGANPTDFAISTGANACGATLAAGSSCSIYVTFTPASATTFSATLSVADNASGSPQTANLTGTGTAPGVSLTSPPSFPNTLTGTTSAALAATLSNTGTAPLNNIIPSITGANPTDFAISTGANACGATLAAGSNCSIYVTFTPASATTFSSTLSVADNASGSPQTATLTGTGTAPIATFTSSPTFPNTLTGTTSAALAATLSNTGTAPLNNIIPSITGTNPTDFAIATGANACGTTLAAGSSCSIYVTFTPASATTFSATLSVADNASGSPQTANLTGTGTAPAALLSSPLSFPNTLTGTTSAAVAATLSNTGNAPLNNIIPSITGTNPTDFAIATGANACGATLAAGSSCSIYVTFIPASATSFSATLSVADNASGSPQTANLTGTGTAPGVSLTSPPSFPNTLTGTTSAALAATLSNTGNAPLNNIIPSITGTNPTDFAIATGANACGATLAAGSSCSIYVTFTPASATSFSATLSVADNASGSPQTATLTGTGTPPPAVELAFTTQPPANATAGITLSPVLVRLEDSNGNTVTGSAASVTITSTPAGVSGTLTVAAVNGVATFSNLVFAATGSYTLSAAATGLTGATSSQISVIAPPIPTIAITGTPVSVAPGATSGNTSTITVTPGGGFTGSVTLTAAVTSSPVGAVYPPTFGFGSTSPVNITGTTAGSATLTVSTTAPDISSLAYPNRPGVPWYAASGAALACVLFFGIPARRRTRWQNMLGMLALLLTLAGSLIACGGGGGGGDHDGDNIAGTTPGTYTVTVTGTSGATTGTGTFTLTIQ